MGTNECSEQLNNGISLVTFSAEQLHTVAFSVVMPFVPCETAGVHHLIEHLMFERAGARDADAINAEMTSRGSEIIGYTSVNHMCFNFSCRQEVFEGQLRLLYDMLCAKQYGKDELDKVFPVIRNEIFEYDFYDARSSDLLRGLWFDDRYTKSVLGDVAELQKLTPEQILQTHSQLFSDKTCLFLAGAFTERDVRCVRELFGSCAVVHFANTPKIKEEKLTKAVNTIGRGKELQTLITYHVEHASQQLKAAAHWLRSALFDGLDASFFNYFNSKGFRFYSVDGVYNIVGDELVFSYLVHIEKKDKRQFQPLIDGFEKFAESTPFEFLTKPYLRDNLVLLYDNPERLCSHYVDVWTDFSRPVLLKEELEITAAFDDATLKGLWKQIYTSLRRVFFIGR